MSGRFKVQIGRQDQLFEIEVFAQQCFQAVTGKLWIGPQHLRRHDQCTSAVRQEVAAFGMERHLAQRQAAQGSIFTWHRVIARLWITGMSRVSRCNHRALTVRHVVI